ncbi:uncharacterized protein SRS1_13797 [Sporisorium reilianum f. sp. reilianum]|uniref:Uncharacterized protein n=1 Tax=Sporisorium reilianum f. sp. reilianum TaxID=72559 RepID=A0A2N8UF21_9BASI|nr:uncharacterized protein SRS1_13797 [Sporisorium reilianum f. sp. reilianum]
MVRFNVGLDSGCIAARLALCLLMGLRLVSASLSESLQGGSTRHEDLNQHQIAPLLSKWDVDVLDSFRGASRKQDRSESANDGLRTSEQRRSLFSEEEVCGTDDHVKHKRESDNKHKPVAGDHAANSTSPSPPPSTFSEEQLDSSDNTSPSAPFSQSSPSNSSLPSATSMIPTSPLAGGILDSNGSLLPPPSSSNNAPLGASPSSSSSSSPPSGQDDPSSTPGALPNIDYGSSSTDNSSNNNSSSSQPQSAPSPAPANGTVSTTESQPSSSSSQRSKTIAAGVTVPIGVIALGLVALVILRKQRQRRNKMQQIDAADGNANEEKAAVSDTQPPPSASNGGVDATPAFQQGVSSNFGHSETRATPETSGGIERENPFQRRGSDEASEASRSTGASAQPASVAHFSNVATSEASPRLSISVPATPSAAASSASHTPQPARGKSLKRKPVPALLEPFDASQLPKP